MNMLSRMPTLGIRVFVQCRCIESGFAVFQLSSDDIENSNNGSVEIFSGYLARGLRVEEGEEN